MDIKRLEPDDEGGLEEVWRLTYNVYLRKGYCGHRSGGMLRHYSELDLDKNPKNTHVFVARDDSGMIVGTNSLTLDGALKLPVDYVFGTATNKVREEFYNSDKFLGASWRLAVLEGRRLSRGSEEEKNRITFELIDACVDYGINDLNLGSLLIEINPEKGHPGFYRRKLGFKKIDGPVQDYNVCGKAGILMRGNKEDIERLWYPWRDDFFGKSNEGFNGFDRLEVS